jgi:polysaccharide export outer membrane protein
VLTLLLASGCASTPKQPPPAAAADELGPPPELLITDATLGPGDTVVISVYRHPDLAISTAVPDDGIITMPLAGDLNVMGRSGREIRAAVLERLDRYLVEPQVAVNIGVQRSRKVMVLGEVERPGVYLVEEPSTALELVARAGGFSREATNRRVLLVRDGANGEPITAVLNLGHVMKGKDLIDNVFVQRGDILYVPKSTAANIDRIAMHLSTWLAPLRSAMGTVWIGMDIYDRVQNTGVYNWTGPQ